MQYKALQRVRVAGCRVQGAGCTDLGLRHRDREVGLERVERIGTQHAKLVGCVEGWAGGGLRLGAGVGSGMGSGVGSG